MPIVPDTKDWTWVLERPCPECGFDTTTVTRDAVPQLLRDNAAAWQVVLGGRDTLELRTRPSEDRWSTLEYACHVRDVFRLFDRRLHLMLDVDDPTFPNWDQDATAIADRYSEQDPRAVVAQLLDAANALADSFVNLSTEQWQRTGTRSDGAHFTVESFARYLTHDPVHHLHDVGGAAAGRGR
jgi:DinB superfamily